MLPGRETFQHTGWSLKYILALISLALLWAVESFVIQSSAFAVPPLNSHPYTYQLIRFSLNFTVATALLLVCRRRVLVLLFAANLLLSLVLVAYNSYFHHTLSIYYGLKALREGSRVTSFGLQLIPLKAWVFLVSAFVLKIFLLSRMVPKPVRYRRCGAGLCLLPVATIILALQFTSFAFPNIAKTRVTRSVFAYGYLSSWAAECFVAPDTKEVRKELVALQNVSPDRLPATEPSWQFGTKVVILQLESLGWNVLSYTINGQKVMPYLNSLAKNSRLFKIRAYHSVSSGDMDYAVLSGGSPTKRMVSFLVPDIPYTNALPRFMREHGFHTASFHGGNGEFFNRRNNYGRMGFDEIWFLEDFRGRAVGKTYWGVKDADLFRMSSEKLRLATGPQFHFIISLDTHGPFDLISDAEKEIFPHSRDWRENHFNSMRALDRNLRSYIESLPKDTLVVLYGDHTSNVDYNGFHSARLGQAEFVPCIVHVCQEPPVQKTNSVASGSLPEDLRIHDVINFLRRQIASR